MRRTGWGLAVALALGSVGVAGVVAPRFTSKTPVGELPTAGKDAAVLPTNQTVTPVGNIVRFDVNRPKDAAWSPDGTLLAVLAQRGLSLLDASGKTVATIPTAVGPLGVAWSPTGNALYVSGKDGKLLKVVRDGSTWHKGTELVLDTVGPDGEPDVAAGTAGRGRQRNDPQVAGLTVSPDGLRLYAALGIRNAVAVVDLVAGKVVRSIDVDIAPYHVALSPDGERLAVACRGGQAARADQQSALSAGSAVRVDPRTDAALDGSVVLLDTANPNSQQRATGIRQPSGMVFSADNHTLWVAGSDDDTVAEVSAATGLVRRRISLRPGSDPGYGQIPTSVALSPEGNRLWVACGGANAVAAVDVPGGKIVGRIPTGWFPIALASAGGKLAVASTKGTGSRVPRADGAFGVHSTRGMVQLLGPDDLLDTQFTTGERVVAANNLWGRGELPARRGRKPVPIPERVGEPSVFRHVVFIIKENQTYDSILGDLKPGNGDPKLCLFPEDVSPNHHALARQFVTLDNTFTSGTNSADGHQWTVSGVANGYLEQNYDAHARSYPYDGGDPLSGSPEGYLWTSAVAAGKSVRVYGEMVNKPRIVHKATGKTGGTWAELMADWKKGMPSYEITSGTDNAALRPLLHPNYIGFPSTVPDQWRADVYLKELQRFERDGSMPALSILLLPNDHTMGTRAGGPTPRAAVADNDLALGRIVEGISKSKFWKQTLIVVIEDDSQLGIDHVDGHRTAAFCISPYTRRGAVVSERYNHTSVLRTIGLVLGLPAMNRFDRTADAMRACFTDRIDDRSFTALPNRVPLDEANPPARALTGESRRLAEACAILDWSDVDRADAGIVARAIWGASRPGVPFPTAAFNPPDDDD